MKATVTTHIMALVSLCILLSSCDGRKIERAKESLTSFQNAYKQEDLDKALVLYPNLRELNGQFRKLDTIEFIDGEVNSDTVIINGQTKWTNPLGKTFSNEVVFYMTPKEIDGKNTYIINDTKGFISFDDSALYKFALKKKKGLSGMTDVHKSNAITNCEYDFEQKKQQARDYINNNLSISGFNWELSYFGNSASGRAVLTNNTGMPLSNIKYKVTYYKSDDVTVVTTDDGTAVYSYTSIAPGESKSFTWYTSYVNGARRANVQCYIDDDNLIEEGAIALAGI